MCVDDTPSFLTKKHYFILMVSWKPLKPADILFEKSAKKIHRNGEKNTNKPLIRDVSTCRLQLAGCNLITAGGPQTDGPWKR